MLAFEHIHHKHTEKEGEDLDLHIESNSLFADYNQSFNYRR